MINVVLNILYIAKSQALLRCTERTLFVRRSCSILRNRRSVGQWSDRGLDNGRAMCGCIREAWTTKRDSHLNNDNLPGLRYLDRSVGRSVGRANVELSMRSVGSVSGQALRLKLLLHTGKASELEVGPELPCGETL